MPRTPSFVQVSDTSVTFFFARRINVTSTLDLVRRDQARARQFAKQIDTLILEATFNVVVTNSGGNYVAKVVAGGLVAPRLIVGRINLVQALHSLKHAFLDSLNIDPGSSNTLVGAEKSYVKTKTSLKISNSVVNIVPTPRLVVNRRLKRMSYALSLRYLASSHLRHHGWR